MALLVAAVAPSLAPAALAAPGEASTQEVVQDLGRIYLAAPDARPLGWAGAAAAVVFAYDEPLRGRANQLAHNLPGHDRWADEVTELGNTITALGLSALVALKDRRTGYLAANAVVYAGLATVLFKATLGVPRPYVAGEEHRPNLLAYPFNNDFHSMPSGHTATAFALAHVLAQAYPAYRWAAYGAAALVGFTRVSLNMHWPSDVVAGAAIGIWAAEQVMERSTLFEVSF